MYFILWRAELGGPLYVLQATSAQADRQLAAIKAAGGVPVARVDLHQSLLEWTGECDQTIVADVSPLLQLDSGYVFRAVRTRPLPCERVVNE